LQNLQRKNLSPVIPSLHYTCSYISPFSYSCLSSLFSISIPKNASGVFAHSRWKQAMIDEMHALQSSGT